MNRDAWQKCGGLMQRLGGKIHAGCDHAAFVITFCADQVEIRRGAKVQVRIRADQDIVGPARSDFDDGRKGEIAE